MHRPSPCSWWHSAQHCCHRTQQPRQAAWESEYSYVAAAAADRGPPDHCYQQPAETHLKHATAHATRLQYICNSVNSSKSHITSVQCRLPLISSTLTIIFPAAQSVIDFAHYQVILPDNRGTCVWTTCPGSLHETGTAGSRSCDVSNTRITIPHHVLWANG